MRVFLDTNFIIDLFRFKIAPSEIFDLLPDAQLFTFDLVNRELKKIAKSTGQAGKHARVALQFIEKAKILPTKQSHVDIAFLQLGKDDVVATNDIALRKKLAKKKIKIIYIRARKHLALS